MSDSLRYEVAQEDHVPLQRKLCYALGVFGEPLFLGTIGNFLVLYYNGVLGLSGILVAALAIMADITDIDELETGKRRDVRQERKALS